MAGTGMKRGVLMGAGAGCVLAAVLAARGVSGQSEELPKAEPREVPVRERDAVAGRDEGTATEIAELRAKVEAQRAYIEQLERELARLRGRPGVPAPIPGPAPHPAPGPAPIPAPEMPNPWPPMERAPSAPGQGEPLPRGWQEKEFNGLKYYLVPVKGAGRE